MRFNLCLLWFTIHQDRGILVLYLKKIALIQYLLDQVNHSRDLPFKGFIPWIWLERKYQLARPMVTELDQYFCSHVTRVSERVC